MNELYLNKCLFEKEYWWKFSNFLSYFFDGNIKNEKDKLIPATPEEFHRQLSDNMYFNVISQYPELCVADGEDLTIKQPVCDIFVLLMKRFADHYVFKTKTDSETEAQEEAYKFAKKLFNVIEYTYKKYSKIIELYNSNYNDLMKQLESTTESGSRFNDTPQSAEVDLSFEENQFTTNLTKTKQVTRTDSNTPIAKIEEIWQNYRKVILEWLNEFESLFVEENNV